AHQHFLAVKGPAFDKEIVAVLPANFVLHVVGDRELEEMSGDSLVPENWPRIFDRRPNVKVLRIRVVCRDEIESGRILVINARRIHEAARAGWLEGFGQLPDLKFPEVIW